MQTGMMARLVLMGVLTLSGLVLEGRIMSGEAASAAKPQAEPPVKTAPKEAFRQDGGRLLPIGSLAPDFNLPATGGKTVKLADYQGKNLLVIFYPMDQTPGCTVQLCALRDEYKRFQALNTEGVASNPASVESHEAFAKKQNYRFPILSDKEHRMAHAYGAEGPLGFNNRTVYILDGRGVVRYAKRGLPGNEELLNAIRRFSKP